MEDNRNREHLFQYAKQRYESEHTRKNEINTSITILLTILILQITAMSYFFLDIPEISPNMFLFYLFLGLSFLSILVSAFIFYRHQTGYEYAYIPSPKEMDEYYKDCKKSTDIFKDEDSIYNEIIETEYLRYIGASENNIQNNDKKKKYYRVLLTTEIITAILIVITFFLSISPKNDAFSLKKFVEKSLNHNSGAYYESTKH